MRVLVCKHMILSFVHKHIKIVTFIFSFLYLLLVLNICILLIFFLFFLKQLHIFALCFLWLKCRLFVLMDSVYRSYSKQSLQPGIIQSNQNQSTAILGHVVVRPSYSLNLDRCCIFRIFLIIFFFFLVCL